jgi:hypothetical protein
VVSSTNRTDHHDIAEILLKVSLNTITPPFDCTGRCKSNYHTIISIDANIRAMLQMDYYQNIFDGAEMSERRWKF